MRKITIILAAFILFLTFSCSKSDLLVNQENPVVTEAKNWFTARQSATKDEVIASQSASNKPSKKLPTTFESLWQEATVHEEENYSIVEVPVKFEKPFTVDNAAAIQNPKYPNGVTKLLVLKNKQTGATDAVLMFTKADGVKSSDDHKKLKKNTYKKKGKDFNGTVSFYDLDWNFINGWEFTEGKVSGKITKVSYADLQNKPGTGLQPGEEIATFVAPPPDESGCTTRPTRWYLETCTYYGERLVNCSYSYLYTTTETICPSTGGTGGVSSYENYINPEDFPETPEILAYENDYRERMTPEEQRIFDNMSRLQQLAYLWNGLRATVAATLLYGNSTLNGKSDAFRHAYFSAFNTKFLGSDLAKRLGDAHETWPGSDPLENEMDLTNNRAGREIYAYLRSQGSTSFDDIVNECIRRTNNGGLRIIHGRSLVPSNFDPNANPNPE